MPRVGKARWQIQEQPGLFRLAFEMAIHLTRARPDWNSVGWYIGMSLKWQLNDIESVAAKNGRSALPDATKRTQKVIPMQHASVVAHFSPRFCLAWTGITRNRR
jgi:hypothetical protein